MSLLTAPLVEQRAQRDPAETTRAVLGAAWLAVRRAPLLVPAAAALVLTLVTIPWQDEQGVRVVHGVAVLLACALASATDDPSGEAVAAAPVPRSVRTLSRVLAALAVCVPVAVLALVVASTRAFFFPTGAMVLETICFAVVAVAFGATLRAWRGLLRPAYPTVIGVVLVVLATYALPRGWTMIDPQPWGPPYQAALIRWTGLLLAAAGVLALALRDPGRGR